MQGAGDEQCNVVDHITVCEVFHELGERTGGVGLDIAELGDKLLGSLVGKSRGGRVGWQRCKKVAIGGRKLQLDICR